jgi:hypothetical protein
MVVAPGLLALMAVACSGGKTVNQVIEGVNTPRVEQVDPPLVITKTEVFTPTPTFSPTPTPTETEVPIVYTDPIPYEQFTSEFARKMLETDYDGGYFIDEPKVENIGDYLMLDLSHEGKLRVLEGKDLNDKSWGIYVKKNQKEKPKREITNANGEGVTQFIIYYIVITDRKDIQVEWGDLELGTTVFVRQSLIDFEMNKYGVSKDFMDSLFPFNDPRFDCEEVESVPIVDSVRINGAGKNCEYIGN